MSSASQAENHPIEWLPEDPRLVVALTPPLKDPEQRMLLPGHTMFFMVNQLHSPIHKYWTALLAG
ncbi:MAG: hypothetical protein AB7G08_32665 [Hyphomicrobiaceae bacterium]